MMIPGFVTIIVIKCHMYDRKKIHSAQNVTDVSFFCSARVRTVEPPEEAKSQAQGFIGVAVLVGVLQL